jgi:pimeloyl-ACP methyl ester carboxylesterase
MSLKHIITTKHFPALAYRRYGSGPALMLLHGFPVTGKLWENIVFSLSQSLTVLEPDIPGAGESRLDGEAASIEELASIVPAILDSAGIGQCTLAGHSMGGYISLAAAARYGDRLNGLALVHSTALADDEEKKAKRRKTIALIRKGGREEFVRGMIPALFSEPFRNAHPEAVDEQIAEGLKLAAESMIAFYNAMINRPERLEVLRSAPFPVMWVLGRDDSTIPWQSCLQQSTLPDVSFVKLYDDCGHMSMIEQKELLQEDLLKFVEYCLSRVEGGLLR